MTVIASGHPANHKPLVATLLMTLLVSGLILYFWHLLETQQQQHLQDEFQSDIAEVKTKVKERMTAYGQVLKGGRSFFLSSQKVTRQEWHAYVTSLELDADYPGIQGIGYAVTIPAKELDAHQRRIRSEGFADYQVWPVGKRALYTSIVYLEPFDWRNQRAFGYDMYSEPTRHEAMQRARDTGQPALTGKVLLVQETDKAPQAGTLLYVPLYRKSVPLETVAERRQALIGWIYSPFRMDNLIEGMLGRRSGDIRLRIFDQSDADAANLLYDSRPAAADPEGDDAILVHQSLRLESAGRTWVLHFDALPGYAQSIGLGSLYQETAGMVLIGLLLIALTWNLFNTQRKADQLAGKLTASLRESEQRWGFALEGSGDGVWDWNVDTGEVFYSPRFNQMLGVAGDGLGNDLAAWQQRVHPEDIDEVERELERHLRGETPEYVAEHRIRHQQGGYIWVLGRGKVTVRAADGLPLRMVGTYSDITLRRRAEEKLRLLSQAMHQIGESIMITDADGVIQYVNPAFTSITGYSEAEVMGQKPSILKSGKQERELYEAMWATIGKGATWSGRIVDRKRDGSLYPAMLTISPIMNVAGEITHFIGSQQDLQEYEELESKFHQSQKMEAIGTLVGGIAHDFNNTLAGITGNLYLAKRQAEGQQALVDRLATVDQLAFRAAAMIEQLLTFSRKGKPEMVPVNIAAFLKETIKLHRVSLPENIELTSDIRCDGCNVMGDINLLQQVLVNLINNARDAVEGRPNPAIGIQLDSFTADASFLAQHPKLNGRVFASISVGDNGYGIDAEHIDHIFEPFFTTKEVGKGTGLGLAMAYGAISSHGGTITVESRPGRGTLFHILLPQLAAEQVGEVDEAAAEVRLGRGETVMLVDDHADALDANREVLEHLGYRVFTAADGMEAVDLYRERGDEIDLVILDVVMPRMGGKEAFEAIRRIDAGARVMFATGYDRANVLRDKALGSMPVIKKPFAVGELSILVRNLLAEGATEQA